MNLKKKRFKIKCYQDKIRLLQEEYDTKAKTLMSIHILANIPYIDSQLIIQDLYDREYKYKINTLEKRIDELR